MLIAQQIGVTDLSSRNEVFSVAVLSKEWGGVQHDPRIARTLHSFREAVSDCDRRHGGTYTWHLGPDQQATRGAATDGYLAVFVFRGKLQPVGDGAADAGGLPGRAPISAEVFVDRRLDALFMYGTRDACALRFPAAWPMR